MNTTYRDWILKHKQTGYFITDDGLKELIEINRLAPLLVRCGGCRFVAGAQYIEFLIKAVEGMGDYVRDVSVPLDELKRLGLSN